MEKSYSGDILGAFFVIWFISWANDWPPLADYEITTYRMVCHDCQIEGMILYREVFKADPATHTVTSWSKEGDSIFMYRDCAIRNRKNWICEVSKTDSTEPRLIDGVFSEKTASRISEQISWYRWWWLRANAALS